jgi:hypothetical protein
MCVFLPGIIGRGDSMVIKAQFTVLVMWVVKMYQDIHRIRVSWQHSIRCIRGASPPVQRDVGIFIGASRLQCYTTLIKKQ